MYLVNLPGIRASSVLLSFNNFLAGSFIWASKVYKAKSLFWKEKKPITLFKYSKVRSSFIQPFEDDAIAQQCLKFLFNAAVFCLTPWKTMKGFIFIPSAFAVKQTLTLTFSLPLNFLNTRGISFAPVALTVMFTQFGGQVLFVLSLRICITYPTSLPVAKGFYETSISILQTSYCSQWKHLSWPRCFLVFHRK